MKIVYFAPIPYDYLKQRPQHIADALAVKHDVVYVEPTISMIHSVIKKDRPFKARTIQLPSKVRVIRLNGMFSFPRCLEYYDFLNLNTISESVQLKQAMKNCDCIWLGSPIWLKVIKRFSEKKIVYDKMDDNGRLTSNKLLRKLINRNEKILIERADAVIVTCQKFYEECSFKNKKTYLIRNGVPFDFMGKLKNNQKREHKVFGYVGAISHWFDFEVFPIILQNEKNEIVLVGDNQLPEYKHPRVHYYGRVAKECIPEIISDFDVCLYNFKINDLLDTINPVKIYEYLAMNKPVLAVKSRETIALEDKLILYSSQEELKVKLESEMRAPFDNDMEVKKFLEENSWENRVEAINHILKQS